MGNALHFTRARVAYQEDGTAHAGNDRKDALSSISQSQHWDYANSKYLLSNSFSLPPLLQALPRSSMRNNNPGLPSLRKKLTTSSATAQVKVLSTLSLQKLNTWVTSTVTLTKVSFKLQSRTYWGWWHVFLLISQWNSPLAKIRILSFDRAQLQQYR